MSIWIHQFFPSHFRSTQFFYIIACTQRSYFPFSTIFLYTNANKYKSVSAQRDFFFHNGIIYKYKI